MSVSAVECGSGGGGSGSGAQHTASPTGWTGDRPRDGRVSCQCRATGVFRRVGSESAMSTSIASLSLSTVLCVCVCVCLSLSLPPSLPVCVYCRLEMCHVSMTPVSAEEGWSIMTMHRLDEGTGAHDYCDRSHIPCASHVTITPCAGEWQAGGSQHGRRSPAV